MNLIIKMIIGPLLLAGVVVSEIAISAEQAEKINVKDVVNSTVVNGFIQTDFYWEDNQQASTFHTRRARLGAKGTVLPKVKYNILAAYDAGNNQPKDLRAFNVFIKYEFNKNYKVTVGQFKYTFDREGRWAAHQMPFINFSRPVFGLVRTLGQTGAFFRDVGAELTTTHKVFEDRTLKYHLGIINGNGINSNDEITDTASDRKDYYARMTYDFAQHLNVGMAGFRGHHYDEAMAGYLNETLWTVDADYRYQKFSMVASVYHGDYEVFNDGMSAPTSDINPFGFSWLASYTVKPKVDLLIRLQRYESDRNTEKTQVEGIDFGLNYYLVREGRWGGTKLSVNYIMREAENNAKSRVWEERGNTVAGDAIEDVIAARFQLVF